MDFYPKHMVNDISSTHVHANPYNLHEFRSTMNSSTPSNPNGTRVSPETIVKAVMEFVGHEDAPGHPRGKLVYKCLKVNCGRIIKYNSKSGFSNPYQHLRCCYAKAKKPWQQHEVLKGLYEDALKQQALSGGTILPHFNVEALCEADCATFYYIRLIFMFNLPISIVENGIFRSISRFGVYMKRRTIVEFMFALCELVEERIAKRWRKRWVLLCTMGGVTR